MKKLIAFLIAAALILSLAACGNSKSDNDSSSAESTDNAEPQGGSIYGTWENTDKSGESYSFYDNGTGSYCLLTGIDPEEITYETTDTEITINYAGGSSAVREYTVDADTFRLETFSGDEKVFTRTSDNATAPTEPNDATLIADTKAQLVGSWTISGMEDYEQLTFDNNGAGSYMGISDKNYTFTYDVSIVHQTFNNGDPYLDYILKVDYNTGESEQIVITIREGDSGNTEMLFNNLERGGYSGIMNFNLWVKQ